MPETKGERRGRPARLAGLAVGVLALLAQLPFLDRGLSRLDEGSILAVSEALAAGESLYADRAIPFAPLTYLALSALFRAFEPDLLVARALQAVVSAGSVWLVFAIVGSLASRRAAWAAAAAALAVKPLGFPLWTVLNYSQVALFFLLLAWLAALRFAHSGRTAWALLAGAAVALTAFAKQNLGAVAGLGVLATVWWPAVQGSLPRSRRVAWLALGGALPAVALLAGFALRGTLDDLFERTVLAALRLPGLFPIPLPGLGLLDPAPAERGTLLFHYLPAAFVGLAMEGGPVLRGGARDGLLALVVLATYYVPIGAFVLGLVTLRRRTPGPWISALVFAGLLYASMLYRADWTHLMNVYPGLLPLFALLGGFGRGARTLVTVLLAAFLASGVAATWAIVTTQDEKLETPRGTLRAARTEVDTLRPVLRFLENLPRESAVAVLPADPLLYFLAERDVPLRFDHLLPGEATESDDRALAEQLTRVDVVLFNPKVLPGLSLPFSAYAPHTAAALYDGFVIERTRGPTAAVLRRHRGPAPETVRPLLASTRAPVNHWLYMRVLDGEIRPGAPERCTAFEHSAARGDALEALPVFAPSSWIRSPWEPGSLGAVFEVRIGERGRVTLPAASTTREPGTPGRRLRIPLAPEAARELRIELCTRAVAGQGAGELARAGWAEPRIVRWR